LIPENVFRRAGHFMTIRAADVKIPGSGGTPKQDNLPPESNC